MRQILKKVKKQQQIIMFEWIIIDMIVNFLQNRNRNFNVKPPNNKIDINFITTIKTPIEIFCKNYKKVKSKIIKSQLNLPILKVLVKLNPKISSNDFNYQIFKNKNCKILKKCNLTSDQVIIFLKIFSKRSSEYICGATDYILITLIKKQVVFNK